MKPERGNTAVTIVIITPTIVILMLFVVFVGRLAATENDVRGAARDAARAASLRSTATSASAEAASVAHSALDARSVSCATLDVTTTLDTGAAPVARVQITCAISTQDLTGLNLPGAKTITATATEPLDVNRGIRP